MKNKLNPRIGEPIRNLGGGATVRAVLSDNLVIACYYGITQIVRLIGRTDPQYKWPDGELTV